MGNSAEFCVDLAIATSVYNTSVIVDFPYEDLHLKRSQLKTESTCENFIIVYHIGRTRETMEFNVLNHAKQ